MGYIDIKLVKTQSQKNIVKNIIENHHSYVASNNSVGRRVDWLIYHDDVIVGMIGLGSGVYPPPKDLLNYLGVSKEEYKSLFNSISNNWRFCVTQHIKNLGTKVLKLVRNDAPLVWKEKYGDDLKYIMTFVGGNKTGAVYKADNWKMIGYTSGLDPNRNAVSMKWNDSEYLSKNFVRPVGGEYKKMIFIKPVDILHSKHRKEYNLINQWFE